MSEPIITKRCCTCKEIKPLSEFHKSRRTKDGHRCYCKICCSQYQKSEKGKAAQKRHAQSEKGKTYRKHYQQNEKWKAYQKCYKQTDKGKKNRQSAINKYVKRYPEKYMAKTAVRKAIKDSKLPRPDTRLCHYCPKPAQQYHHHKGYEPKHWLDVVPVCIDCHHKIKLL